MNIIVSVNGSDNGNGSELNPYATVSKAMSVTNPGDVILCRGGVWALNSGILWTKAGIQAAPITIKNYPNEEPIFDGQNKEIVIFSIYQAPWVILDGLTARNTLGTSPSSTGMGFYVGTYSASAPGHIILRNLKAYNLWCSGFMVNSSWTRNPVPNRLTDILIENCKAYNTNIGGSDEGLSLIGVDHATIQANYIHDVAGKAHYPHNKECYDLKCGGSNIVFRYNVAERGRYGFYLDSAYANSDDILFLANIARFCTDGVSEGNGFGLASESNDGRTLSNIRYFNNLVYKNLTNGFTCLAYNSKLGFQYRYNTHFKNGASRDIYLPAAPTYQGCGISDDILVGVSGATLISSQPPGVTINNNLFWNAGGSIGGVKGTNPITADPKLVDPENGNFHLQATSPAKNVGIASGAPSDDFDGIPRPIGIGFDIGAFEEVPMAAYVFPPSAAKTAKVPVTVIPSGLTCECEVFIGPDQTHPITTSGKITFTSTGASQNVNCPISMPAAAGAYKAYINITSGGYLIAGFVDVSDIVIPSGAIGPIVWS